MTEEPNNGEWQAPPPPELIKKEEPQMSEASTLVNIFFDPGNTFDDLRRKPRFLMATIIMVILTTAFSFAFYYKVGEQNWRRFMVEQIEKSPQGEKLNAEQKENAANMNMTITAVIRYLLPVFIILSIAIGGLIYWLGGKAFGGTGNYLHGISTWVYSSFPPAVVSMVANLIILIFKSVDDIDIAASQRGVVQANPSMFLDGKSMPVLTTLISAIDLFLIWGWILAAIGLQRTNKISSGSAWAITIILGLIGITLRVVGAFMSGNPS